MSHVSALAVVFSAERTVEIQECTVPSPTGSKVLVQTENSVISPGTEMRCLLGNQHGQESWGYVPGYTQSGIVIEAGPEATVKVGTRVFARGTSECSLPRQWGGHINHALVNSDAVIPLDDRLAFKDAPLASLAAISLRGVRMVSPEPGETVAVVGLGVIGQLSARLFRAVGAKVTAFDTDSHRVVNAKVAGLNAYVVEGDLDELALMHQPNGFDILVEATGSLAVLRDLHKLGRFKPWGDTLEKGVKVVQQASFAEDMVFPYQEFFRLEPTFFVPRDTTPADIRTCLSWMAEGRFPFADLISEQVPFDQAPLAYRKLLNHEPGYITASIKWR